jgi:hypothetical protein
MYRQRYDVSFIQPIYLLKILLLSMNLVRIEELLMVWEIMETYSECICVGQQKIRNCKNYSKEIVDGFCILNKPLAMQYLIIIILEIPIQTHLKFQIHPFLPT